MIDHTAVTHDSLAPDRLTLVKPPTEEELIAAEIALGDAIDNAWYHRRTLDLMQEVKRLRAQVSYLMGAHDV